MIESGSYDPCSYLLPPPYLSTAHSLFNLCSSSKGSILRNLVHSTHAVTSCIQRDISVRSRLAFLGPKPLMGGLRFEPALCMETYAAFATQPLRRAFRWRIRPSEPHRLVRDDLSTRLRRSTMRNAS